jgi:TPR repeat protein
MEQREQTNRTRSLVSSEENERGDRTYSSSRAAARGRSSSRANAMPQSRKKAKSAAKKRAKTEAAASRAGGDALSLETRTTDASTQANAETGANLSKDEAETQANELTRLTAVAATYVEMIRKDRDSFRAAFGELEAAGASAEEKDALAAEFEARIGKYLEYTAEFNAIKNILLRGTKKENAAVDAAMKKADEVLEEFEHLKKEVHDRIKKKELNDQNAKGSAETTEAANAAASTLGGDSGGIPSSATPAELARRATDGCGASAFELALRFRHGTGGVARDPSVCERWLERSCDLSHAPALVYSGRVKFEAARIPTQHIRNIVEHSLDELESTRASLVSHAAEYFARAAEQGNADAEVLLAKAYLDGSGVEENATKSAELNRSAAEKGNVTAQARVSCGHLHGQNGFEKDFVKYEHWLRKAAANEVDDPKLGWTKQDALAILKKLRRSKSKTLDAIAQASGLVFSSEAKVAFVLGPLPEHTGARILIHHTALCFLHGVCGLEKSVRLAKDVLKISMMQRPEYDTDDDITARKSLLKQIRRCSGCGKYAHWTCKLCRGVRYCSRRCQKWHWKHGDGEPHKIHCPRVVTTISEDMMRCVQPA